VKVTIAPFVDE
jgi:hypothetical protein